MTFQNPLGLLGLISILLLIIIYILKPKYEDKALSSTYIWKLSLKYRRPKTPFDWLKSSLLFIIQVLILTLFTLILTKPYYKQKTPSGEKIIILDASASMHKHDFNQSYFELSKKEIINMAETTTPKDRITIIYASNNPYYVVRRSDSIDYIKQSLTNLNPTYESVDLSNSTVLIENILRENPSSYVYLYTNKELEHHKKINKVNINLKEENTGITDFKAVLQPNGYYNFQADLINYGKDKDVSILLYVNGSYKTSKIVNMKDGEQNTFSFDDYEVLSYEKAAIKLDVLDGYEYDNFYEIYGKSKHITKVLMYSEGIDESMSTLFFVKNALESLNHKFQIDIITKEEDLESFGYDLYIYDSYKPSIAPIDGSIWIFNPVIGNSFQNIVTSKEVIGNFTSTKTLSSTLLYRKITANLLLNDISLTKYNQIVSYSGYEKILEIGSDPILLANDNGNQKTVVFGFDLSYSTLPVIPEFPLLIQNLFNYTNPQLTNTKLFDTGSTIEINKKSDALELSINFKEVETIYHEFPFDFKLEEPGVYKITQKMILKDDETHEMFVKIPSSESLKEIKVNDLILTNIPKDDKSTSSSLVDLTFYLSLLLMVLIFIEWGLQYREQY